MSKEAEPVAWVAFNLDSNCYMWSYIYFDSKSGDLGWGSKYELRPIYSHPPRPEPARKPMKEEYIRILYGDDNNFELTAPYVIGFARAIERYHGIGGDDE